MTTYLIGQGSHGAGASKIDYNKLPKTPYPFDYSDCDTDITVITVNDVKKNYASPITITKKAGYDHGIITFIGVSFIDDPNQIRNPWVNLVIDDKYYPLNGLSSVTLSEKFNKQIEIDVSQNDYDSTDVRLVYGILWSRSPVKPANTFLDERVDSTTFDWSVNGSGRHTLVSMYNRGCVQSIEFVPDKVASSGLVELEIEIDDNGKKITIPISDPCFRFSKLDLKIAFKSSLTIWGSTSDNSDFNGLFKVIYNMW